MHLTESEEKMDKKITGVVGYITWIGWLIAYLLGDKEGAKFHLNQGAVLALAEIIVSAAAWFIGKIPIIGFLCGILFWVVDIVLFILAIIGIINALKEENKELPIIGGIRILK